MCLHLCDASLGPGDDGFLVPDVAHAFLAHGCVGPLGEVGQFLQALLDGERQDVAVGKRVDAQQERRDDDLFCEVRDQLSCVQSSRALLCSPRVLDHARTSAKVRSLLPPKKGPAVANSGSISFCTAATHSLLLASFSSLLSARNMLNM